MYIIRIALYRYAMGEITLKKFVTGLTGLLLSVSLLAGCGGAKTPEPAKSPAASEASKTPTLDKIKKDGKLVIGTSPDYPPFESLDKDNKVVGFDIDLMQAVADKLGVKLEVVQLDFGSLIAALNAKKFDIMAAGVSVTDERKKSVDFSTPYLIGKDALLAHKDIAPQIKGVADLKGKKVAVQLGTVQADEAKKVEGAQVKEYNLFTEAASAVSAKQADVVYLHSQVAKSFVNADKNLVIAAEIPSKDTAFALRKDTPDLTAVVNETITGLQKSGEFDKLVAKWFK
jgi:polar amino acid transport system substrate-binding protein